MTKKFKYQEAELPFYEYSGNARHILQLIKDEVQELENSGYSAVEMWFNSTDCTIVLKGDRLESDEEYAQRLAEDKREREEYLRLKAKFEPNN